MIHPGELAPHFKLDTLRGASVDLWDFRQRKNLVLVFVAEPKTLCDLGQAFSSEARAYREEAAEILFICRGSTEELVAAAGACTAPFPVLHDRSGAVFRAYLGAEARGRKHPAVFVLDRYGEVIRRWDGMTPAHLPDHDEILSTLDWVQRFCPE
ncbi:MAG: hypothetical protein D6743_18205 [Calditrichaeota bacterium]|nr:MAG: hypothetical protein D6743_18205 [Calditrichota bacterium]